TLGREGSDFTAAILAYLLNAESVSIWKDVPGIMNADPAWYPNPEKIDFLSYQEAIELTFYGAKVIHPRTVKPLENKRIPLYVKSFVTPETEGTCIAHSDKHISYPPIYILKHNQVLLSISPKDFSFIAEDHISHFFALLNKHRTHVNLIQNSAISFSACADTNSETFSRLIGDLQKKFTVRYNDKLTLITIRHYNEEAVMKMTKDRSILLEQRSRNTVRYIVKESL
nr:aspartate kinase [Bacteroidales bacterium]